MLSIQVTNYFAVFPSKDNIVISVTVLVDVRSVTVLVDGKFLTGPVNKLVLIFES
jgi:hypothetical protein